MRLRAKSVMCFESLVSLLIDKLDKLGEKVQAQGTTLDKLDEKLQAQVSTLWEIRYRMDSLERRLGELDSKVDRQDRHVGEVDTSIGRRFDKLSEAIAAHDHKDSSAKEQLVRKVDNAYERIVYMENNSISKIQATTGAIMDKATTLEAVGQVAGRVRDALAAELSAVHAKVNATHDHILNASRAVAPQDDADETEAGRKACVDASETATKTLKQHIDAKADLMSNKVYNLYNDMWRRVNALESTAKSIISLSNATRRDVQSLNVEVRGVQHSQQGRGGYHGRQSAPEPGNLEYALNMHDDAVDRHLKGLRDTLLDELRNVQQVQDAFLRTCSRLNDKDLSTEDKLSLVLSHHTDYLIKHGDDLADIKRALKTHKASFNATDGAKRLETVARGLAEQGRVEARKVAEALARLENITAAVQNATERVSGCTARPEPADEDAAWSALLQHKETTTTPEPPEPVETLEHRAADPAPGPGRIVLGGGEGSRLNVTSLNTSTTTPTTTTIQPNNPLDLVDGNLLLSRRDHAQHTFVDTAETGKGRQGARGSGQLAQDVGGAIDSSQDSNGLHGQTISRRESVHAVGQDTTGSADSSQDSVTDLSSVDDEDYTEENDDETEFVD